MNGTRVRRISERQVSWSFRVARLTTTELRRRLAPEARLVLAGPYANNGYTLMLVCKDVDIEDVWICLVRKMTPKSIHCFCLNFVFYPSSQSQTNKFQFPLRRVGFEFEKLGKGSRNFTKNSWKQLSSCNPLAKPRKHLDVVQEIKKEMSQWQEVTKCDKPV